MKRNFKMFLILMMGIILVGGCNSNEKDLEKKDLVYVQMEIRNYGTIKLELDPNVAPITVENFVNLVEKGFYNGLTERRRRQREGAAVVST